ncbi:hypothetical protein TSUD_16800, partial [Trifolium subterraneum]
DVDRFKLGNPRSFHYLNQSNCFELDALDDSKEYLDTRRAMDVVGISKDEQSLEDSFCKRVMVTRGDTITKCLDPDSAALSRDALAKIVYSRLFDWIVDKINNSIGQDATSKNLIGVLDIYGFESFKTNSFEQFCINLTNEKLQQHFNQHVFKMEQEEYTKEEIDWSYIEFVDNQDVLDLIEKKPGGVIALLDEACMFPRSTHETFAEKLYQTLSSNKRFSKPKLSRTGFTINHYAGDVTYQTDLFLDKNKDYVVPEHAALLSASNCSFVSGLFPPLPEETMKSTKFSSIAAQFKQQLQSLLETLNATEPHYIRCVKPNNLLKPGIFENNDVLQQLRCGGVMEAIRISCAGYPTRKTFDEFAQRFKILEPNVLKSCPDEVTACKRLLDKANLKGYQVGKTKVFLRAGQMAELDACRAEVLGRSAIVIQKKARTFICEKKYKLLRFSATIVQTAVRGQLARLCYERMRREAASVIIQKQCRMYLSRSAYKTTYARAVCIQTGMRGMAARNELRFRRRTQAAIVIQGRYRCHRARTYYKRLKRATIAVQCSWRRTRARRELRKLRMAAKESKALEAAKQNLEKQVEELISSLESEKRMREAETQENEKLQHALEEMEVRFKETTTQFEETKTKLAQECEAAKKLAEQTPTIRENENENNVVDNELINKLTAENEKLKELLNSTENKPKLELPDNATDSEVVNKLTEENEKLKELVNSLEKKNKDDMIPAHFTENEVISKLSEDKEQLKDQVKSLEQKVDETEKKYEECSRQSEDRMNQIIETESKMIELKTKLQRLEEKFSDLESENQIFRKQALSSTSQRMTDKVAAIPPLENGQQAPVKTLNSTETVRRSHMERHQESVDALFKCVTKDLGFCEGKPVAAFTLYNCLLHWKSFEAEKTSIFDRLIQLIGSAIEDQDNNNCMAYWLSNTSALFFHLQRCLRAPARKPPTPTGFFGRMTQGFRSSNSLSSGAFDVVQQVDAKYPALLFKQQLAAYVEKIYGIVRENMKKELSPLLSSCIKDPKDGSSQPTGSWHDITECLNKFLNVLKENYVPPVLIQKVFNQTFQYINAEIFNSLILHKECCTLNNGEYVKSGLAELEQWCNEVTEEYYGTALDELNHSKQAVRFMATEKKDELSYDDLTNDICPVTTRIKLLMTDDVVDDDKSFLLEDHSR